MNFLGRLFATPVSQENREDVPAVRLLPPFCLLNSGDAAQLLEGMERHYAPLNDWLYLTLRSHTKRLISNDNRYTFAFDKLEILLTLSYMHHVNRQWAPPGAYGYRSWREENSAGRIMQEIQNSISSRGEQSPFVRSGIFGDTVETCTQVLARFGEFVGKLSSRWS